MRSMVSFEHTSPLFNLLMVIIMVLWLHSISIKLLFCVYCLLVPLVEHTFLLILVYINLSHHSDDFFFKSLNISSTNLGAGRLLGNI